MSDPGKLCDKCGGPEHPHFNCHRWVWDGRALTMYPNERAAREAVEKHYQGWSK